VQWRAVVEHAYTGGGDENLLRLLFERPDRSEVDRAWLLDTVYPFLLAEVLSSPIATIDHARQVLGRSEPAQGQRWSEDDVVTRTVAKGLARNARVADDEQLLRLTVELVGRVGRDDELFIARDWPAGRPCPPALLWALLDRASNVSSTPLGPWDKPATEPVPHPWPWLWSLLSQQPPPVWIEAAHRYLRVQAVLLECSSDLEQPVLSACRPVLEDPQLGGPRPLSNTGRLSTLRRWISRHPRLTTWASPALAAVARDAVAALSRPQEWNVVDVLVQSTSDPDLLADAVRKITTCLDQMLSRRAAAGAFGHDSDVEDVRQAARIALATLSGCPHTPDSALVDVLPLVPRGALDDLAAARPHLEDACTAERLARTGTHQDEKAVPLVEVADDAELAATGNPTGVLTGYLTHLPQAGRAQASWLAVQLLRSRYANATVLAALPAEIVLRSPWHAALAGQMLAEACGDDPQRWTIQNEVLAVGLTFGGYLAEIRHYVPAQSGSGLAGYRHCQDCQLTGPHEWTPCVDDQPASRNFAARRPGWMTCHLCRHNAPPSALLPADSSGPCPACGTAIDHPAPAVVLACPWCEQLCFAPVIPDDLRPRLEAVLAEQQRRSELIQAFASRLDITLDQDEPGDPADAPTRMTVTARVTTLREPAPRPDVTPPRDGWLTDAPAGQQFRAALFSAIRHRTSPARAAAARLRYGLGQVRRPRTIAEVADKLGVSPGTVQRNISACLTDIHRSALAAGQTAPTAGGRASVIAVYLADQALGDLDINGDDDLAGRIGHLLTDALPGLETGVGVRLLLRLTGRHQELTPGWTAHLISTVHADRS